MDDIYSLLANAKNNLQNAKTKMNTVEHIPIMAPNPWEGNINNISVNGQNGFDKDGVLTNPHRLFNAFNDGKTVDHYQLSIIVDQPGELNNGNDYLPASNVGGVGHTSIGLQKINTDNTATSATIGFYPKPGKDAENTTEFIQGEARGLLRNDAVSKHVTHFKDVEKTFRMNEQQFNSVKEYITNSYYEKSYHLITYNCTDFAREVAISAGIEMPSASVANPAWFGRDLKNMR